jgi:uncharacterized protein YqeY
VTNLVATIKAEMKAAMKARDKPRLGTIRLIQAEFKRIEVDERIDIDDARALTILDKMVIQKLLAPLTKRLPLLTLPAWPPWAL